MLTVSFLGNDYEFCRREGVGSAEELLIGAVCGIQQPGLCKTLDCSSPKFRRLWHAVSIIAFLGHFHVPFK